MNNFRNIRQNNYILSETTLDEIVLLTQEYAEKSKIDKASASRYGFLIDNALDFWMQHGASGKTVAVTMKHRHFTPTVFIEMEGEKLDPYSIKASDFGNNGKDIIVLSGQVPEFDYCSGINIVSLKLTRERNTILRIGIVCIAALIAGIFGNLFLTYSTREMLLTSIITPIVDMFFNLLRCIAGPMVFLSVIWGICGIGDSRLFGKVGKKVLIYSFKVTALGALVGALSFFILGNGFAVSSDADGNINSLFEMILDIVPSSVVDPFSTGNTLQIIFLAIAVGFALIIMGNRVNKLVSAVDQLNITIKYIMEIISKLVPCVVFLLLINIIWTRTFDLIYSMWEFFAALIGAFSAISIIVCAITAVKHKTGFFTVAKKNISSFIIALTTAASAAAFSSNMKAAKERFGIDDDLSEFSIPLGMIVHNPIAACYNIILVIYFASVYGVSCSVGWLMIGVVMATVVAISTPPIPGGAAASYALLFTQMGIPNDALAIVLVLDVVTDFVVTAFECYVLPISLVNIAKSLDRLNDDVLRDND